MFASSFLGIKDKSLTVYAHCTFLFITAELCEDISPPPAPHDIQLAESLEEASAHLVCTPLSPLVPQSDLFIEILNEIIKRLGNIEESMKDLYDEVAHVRGRVDGRHKKLACEKAGYAEAETVTVSEAKGLQCLRLNGKITQQGCLV
jgi:hypothetical protein